MLRFTFIALATLLSFCILCIFAAALLPLAVHSISSAYVSFPDQSSDKYTAFLSASGSIVAFFSVVAAIVTFALNSRAARNAQRKQHTITVLLDTRLSSEFQETIEKRRYLFPEYSDVLFEEWNRARTATAENLDDEGAVMHARRQRESALAVTQLLNYYEFLAVGILKGDLDKDMLYKTLRSIMCNLVDDCRHLIAEMQRGKPSTYAHLTALYAQWRKLGAKDINGNPNERPIPKL